MYPDGTAPSAPRYFRCSRYQLPLLLRRTQHAGGLVDEAFGAGQWQPTKIVIDYLFGHADDVDDVTEAQARRMSPEAFPPPS